MLSSRNGNLLFSLLSVLLSALIPLAPVNFSFSTNLYPAPALCLSQAPAGIAPGHCLSLLPLSALSIPPLPFPLLERLLIQTSLFPSISLCLIATSGGAKNLPSLCSQTLRAQSHRVAVGGSAQLKCKYHIMLRAFSEGCCHLHLLD